MTAGVRERVEARADTHLDRLGSQKYLLARTGANLDPGPVLAAAVDERHHARITFEQWAADEQHDPAEQGFIAAAGREREAKGRLAAELQSFGVTHSPPEDPGALQDHLRGIEDTAARIGAGLVGGLLVADRTLLQYVGFFVNEADDRRADIFREIRTELRQGLPTADWIVTERLPATSEDTVVEAAIEAIAVAYQEYADGLASLGLDPKPVC